ncbi:MAG: DUF2071 domain-containing protein [Acidobacteria bacterium]|nr:DUF2071 domain-containing protein [Acidobacteriota bacterium]
MFEFLKNHPFAVSAFFQSSTVLAFAVPKAELQSRIPECLELDTFQDQWAFLAVAMVQTSGLRPTGLPQILGNDFFLIGYRIFVRYTNTAGKRLRGLYILKSETDKKKMELLGNLFTHYKYTTTDITQTVTTDFTEIQSAHSKFKITIDHTTPEVALPEGSPFPDWKEARKFAGPLPFTFTYKPATKQVLIIEGVRQNWTPEPIKIKSYEIDFLNRLNLSEVRLANAFIIKNIPYQWKKGRIEQWQ